MTSRNCTPIGYRAAFSPGNARLPRSSAILRPRSLRERLAFPGEIRATGNILPDNYAFLRCGVTTVEMQDGTDPAAWQNAADRFSFAYQPLRTQRADPPRPSPNDATWRVAKCQLD
jgi:uncharacterized protein (DUF934 family)